MLVASARWPRSRARGARRRPSSRLSADCPASALAARARRSSRCRHMGRSPSRACRRRSPHDTRGDCSPGWSVTARRFPQACRCTSLSDESPAAEGRSRRSPRYSVPQPAILATAAARPLVKIGLRLQRGVRVQWRRPSLEVDAFTKRGTPRALCRVRLRRGERIWGRLVAGPAISYPKGSVAEPGTVVVQSLAAACGRSYDPAFMSAIGGGGKPRAGWLDSS